MQQELVPRDDHPFLLDIFLISWCCIYTQSNITWALTYCISCISHNSSHPPSGFNSKSVPIQVIMIEVHCHCKNSSIFQLHILFSFSSMIIFKLEERRMCHHLWGVFYLKGTQMLNMESKVKPGLFIYREAIGIEGVMWDFNFMGC